MNRANSALGRVYLTNAFATRNEKRIAGAIALVALVLFVGVAGFAGSPLLQLPAFIPSYEAALFFVDLTTAALLYDQAIRQRSTSLIVLAAGYLFDAFIIVPHALSFPGAFAPTGLLGAKSQTTAWLYVFWHGGFPLFAIAYAMLRNGEANRLPPSGVRIEVLIVISIAGAAVLTAGLSALATRQHDLLPVVVQGGDYTLLVSKGVSPAVWVITFVGMLSLWARPLRAIDLWLILVMWIWLFDIGLSAVISSHRFDLGFYAGRLFGLVASGFLLVTLILELAKIYAVSLMNAERAEQRMNELMEQRRRPEPTQRKKETISTYIHRENIARYRALLELQDLDDVRREQIKKLLAEEEAKDESAKASNHQLRPGAKAALRRSRPHHR